MRVTMRTNITGFRNGEPWPAPGESIDLPDAEAAGLIANGYAKEASNEEVPAEPDDPTPDVDSDPEAGSDNASDAADQPVADVADEPTTDAEPVADPTPDVEQATAAPGKKRTTRRAKPKG